MNNLLKQFYLNENEREAVQEFILNYLNELAIEKVMKREDTSSIADAKEVLVGAFIKLKDIYGDAPKPNIPSSR